MHIQKPKFLYLHSTFYIDVNTITRMSEFLSTIACVSFFVCTFCCYINIYFFLIVFIFILLYSFNTSFVIIGIPHLYHSSKSIFSHHHVISDVHFLLQNYNFCILYKNHRNKTSANNVVVLTITVLLSFFI